MEHKSRETIARACGERIRVCVADEPKAFAYDIGISLSALYNYMNGRIPSTEVMYRIVKYTGQSFEWFMGEPQSGGGPML